MSAADPMRTLLEQATRELRRLRAENERLTAQRGPIAVIGLGCRFPGGANDPEAFWKLLESGAEAIHEVPPGRWPLTPDEPRGARWAGLLDVPLADFDAEFFALSGRELESLDPQQRLLLEVAWESLEHAGLALDRARSRVAGVFIGLANLDYRERVDARPPDVYSATGNLHSTAAGRLSYNLDLHGPSLAVDTACSSSLVAVHLAIQSLQRGECELALAGGVQLLLSPRTMHKVATTLGLAPDGRCRAFDARAQGLVRAEGCGVILLKRLADAQRDGDTIRAVLRGSAVNHNGATLGMTAPSPLAQERLLRAALADAGLAPEQVSCIEAMAAGSPLGDAIEVEALHAVYGAPRPDGSRCAVASLKTNLGHMEAASGIGGLIKTILALEHERIPPHLHLEQLHPQIRLNTSALTIPTRSEPWPRTTTPRRAGVSAFGISGTNAHVLVEEAPATTAIATPDDGRVVLLPISARSPAALKALLARHRAALAAPTDVSLPDLAHALALGRSHEPYRRALVGRTRADLIAEIDASRPASPARGRPQIVLVCPGHAPGWPNLASLLFEEPAFLATFRACEAALQPFLKNPPSSLAEQLQTQTLAEPTLWALELALAAVWRAWGVEPDALVASGVGELAAAHLAGVLTLEDAARIVAARQHRADNLADISPQPAKLPINGVMAHDPQRWLRGDGPPLPELAVTDTVLIGLAATGHGLPSITPGDEPLALRRALAAVYEAGHPVTWAQPDPRRRHIALPHYPWQRERFWIDLAPEQSLPDEASPPPIDRPSTVIDALRTITWRPVPLAPAAPTSATIWLTTVDPEADLLNQALTRLGATPLIKPNIDDPPIGSIDTIVVLLADTIPAMPALAASQTVQQLRALVRAIVQRGDRDPPRLVLITRGAIDGVNLEHAAVWGLGRTVMHEHPALACTLIDLESGVPLPADLLAHEILGPDGEDQISLNTDQPRRCARLVHADATPRTSPAAGRSFRLEQDTPGALDGLILREHPRSPPPAGTVEIAVEAAGLNFLDVLRALAAMPADDAPLGAECVGIITALGPDIDDLQVGDRVLALADGALGTHVHASRALVVRLPANLDAFAAATLPIATLTAWQALHHVARLQPGERVLIHAAAGGVGQAAVQIALARGAVVFGTAGTPAKRAALTTQGVHHVASSRDRSFVDVFRAATHGEGVDVVLNCLAGDLLDASLELLRDDGRFIEIGKRDYLADRPIGLAPFLRRLTWSLVDLRGMMQDPQRLRPLLAEVEVLWRSGALRPLPHRTLPIADVAAAFAAMARGEHTGKLVLDLTAADAAPIASARDLPLQRPGGAVLLTRADPISLRLALTLVDRGAAHVAILDPDLPDTDPDLHALQRRATVQLLRTPLAIAVTTLAAPLVAIIHTPAAAAPTSLLAAAPSIERALAEAWQLHELCAAHPIEHLVLCTRATATLGAPGHAADACIATFLAALAHHRRARGLPALCIEWGMTDDAALTPDESAAVLAELLARDAVHVTAMRLHLRRWRESHLARARAPLLAELRDDARGDGALRAHLLTLDAELRADAVQSHLLGLAAKVLRRPAERLELDTPLQQAGLDSLLALELRNRLEVNFDVPLSPTVIWRHPSLRSLKHHLLERLADSDPARRSAHGSPAAPESPAAAADDVAGIARFLAEVAALADANHDSRTDR